MEWKAGGIASYVSGSDDEKRKIPLSGGREVGTFPTLTDVQRGRSDGRSSDDDITLLVNTGTQGVQFASVAGRVLHLAEERDLGTMLPTEWFLQDIRD